MAGSDGEGERQRPWGGRPARRMREMAKVTLPWVCGWCGKAIEHGLPPNHPMGWTLDHIFPRSAGGPVYLLEGCIPMHRRCNSAKGKGFKPPPTQPSEPHSQQW